MTHLIPNASALWSLKPENRRYFEAMELFFPETILDTRLHLKEILHMLRCVYLALLLGANL